MKKCLFSSTSLAVANGQVGWQAVGHGENLDVGETCFPLSWMADGLKAASSDVIEAEILSGILEFEFRPYTFF